MKLRLLISLTLLMLANPISNAAPVNLENQIVLIDTSGSMKGETLVRAQDFLIQGLKQSDTSKTPLVFSFAEESKSITFQGKSDNEIRGQITLPKKRSHTRLYDIIKDKLPMASARGYGITVISDGDDSKSSTSLPELLKAVSNANVKITFISEFLDSRFLSVAERLATIYKSEAVTTDENRESGSQLPYLQLIIASSTGLLSFISIFKLRSFLSNRSNRQTIKSLINSSPDSDNPIPKRFFSERTKLAQIFQGLKLPPILTSKKAAPFTLIALIGFTFLFAQLLNSFILAIVVVFATLLLSVNLKNRHVESKQRQAFEKELPAALRMLASSLTAGMSFLQALNAFAEDDQGPCANEFKRALVEIQFGAPIERALEAVATRMGSEDLRWAVSAFALQREVGGSLASILNSTAQSIESRFELRREVRTLSAEGRVSSYILMALPIGIFTFLSLLRPQYVSVFITEPIGNLLLILILIFLTLAWFWLKALVRIAI